MKHGGGLPERDVHFGVAARSGRVHRSNDPFNVLAQDRPLRISENDDGNFPAHQILLIPDVFVGGHKQSEAGRLGGIEQSAVCEPLPSTLNRFDDHMTFQCVSQRGWRAVVKQDKHLPLMSCRAAGLAMGRGFARQIPVRSQSVPASGGTTP